MSASETERLERVADWYSSHDGFYGRLVGYGFDALRPHFSGSSLLEMGPADGNMTAQLLDAFEVVCSLEGSATYVERLREAFGDRAGFSVVHALFEEAELDRTYETVLCAHVMEHLADPVGVMKRVHDWLAPGGRFIVHVPNALSLHRRAAVHMGLLEAPDALNDLDVRLGHRRVYDPALLRSHLEQAGWEVVETGGVFIKPLSNGQIADWFTPEMCDAFAALAGDLPDLAGEIFAVCRPAGGTP